MVYKSAPWFINQRLVYKSTPWFINQCQSAPWFTCVWFMNQDHDLYNSLQRQMAPHYGVSVVSKLSYFTSYYKSWSWFANHTQYLLFQGHSRALLSITRESGQLKLEKYSTAFHWQLGCQRLGMYFQVCGDPECACATSSVLQPTSKLLADAALDTWWPSVSERSLQSSVHTQEPHLWSIDWDSLLFFTDVWVVCAHCGCPWTGIMEGKYPLCDYCKQQGHSPLLKRKRKLLPDDN
jgi:hypothetical protein